MNGQSGLERSIAFHGPMSPDEDAAWQALDKHPAPTPNPVAPTRRQYRPDLPRTNQLSDRDRRILEEKRSQSILKSGIQDKI